VHELKVKMSSVANATATSDKISEIKIPLNSQNVLRTSGILDAYEKIVTDVCKNGLPEGDIYEYAACEVLKFESVWRDHLVYKLSNNFDNVEHHIDITKYARLRTQIDRTNLPKMSQIKLKTHRMTNYAESGKLDISIFSKPIEDLDALFSVDAQSTAKETTTSKKTRIEEEPEEDLLGNFDEDDRTNLRRDIVARIERGEIETATADDAEKEEREKKILEEERKKEEEKSKAPGYFSLKKHMLRTDRKPLSRLPEDDFSRDKSIADWVESNSRVSYPIISETKSGRPLNQTMSARDSSQDRLYLDKSFQKEVEKREKQRVTDGPYYKPNGDDSGAGKDLEQSTEMRSDSKLVGIEGEREKEPDSLRPDSRTEGDELEKSLRSDSHLQRLTTAEARKELNTDSDKPTDEESKINLANSTISDNTAAGDRDNSVIKEKSALEEDEGQVASTDETKNETTKGQVQESVVVKEVKSEDEHSSVRDGEGQDRSQRSIQLDESEIKAETDTDKKP